MLRPRPIERVPEEPSRVAHAAFPKGTVYLTLRDALGGIYEAEAFAPLFPTRGQPAAAPWRLALVTVLPCAEGLADRQAADAVRSRMDWNYALGLPLDDAGFDASIVSEVRTRLVAGGAEQQLFDRLLDCCRTAGFLRAGGRQRSDSTRVLAAIRALNRLEVVGERVRHALNVLAVVAPDWVRAQLVPEWAERYGPRMDDYRLPTGAQARVDLAEAIGRDGVSVRSAVDAPAAAAWLREVPAVETLRQVWVQQDQISDGIVRWRSSNEIPPGRPRCQLPV